MSQVYRKKFRALYGELSLSHEYRWDWVIKQDKIDRQGAQGHPDTPVRKKSVASNVKKLVGVVGAMSLGTPKRE